jgi:hypothetical protein
VFYNAGSVVRRTGGVSSCRSQTIVRRSGHIGRLTVRSCVEYLSNKWLRQQILECADLSALLTKAPTQVTRLQRRRTINSAATNFGPSDCDRLSMSRIKPYNVTSLSLTKLVEKDY